MDRETPNHPPELVAATKLATRLKRRDRDAIEELSEMFGNALSRAAWVYLGDHHAAADVVQETLITAWDSARKLKKESNLRPWLFGILFNRCRKVLRTLSRRRKREERAGLARYETNESPDTEPLHRALRQLDADSRKVVVLRYLEEMNVEQTALALGIAEGTVKSRTHTALQKLKQLMETSRE
ncbi:RNA polymerase sigma factor [Planctomycetota bacterium]|nr:RNA polymerase sigma factor [Planctomycetota bacterium]